MKFVEITSVRKLNQSRRSIHLFDERPGLPAGNAPRNPAHRWLPCVYRE
jgi:hypothetical protein